MNTDSNNIGTNGFSEVSGEQVINLNSLGGQQQSINTIVDQLIFLKREQLFSQIIRLNSQEQSNSMTFDGMAFKALLGHHEGRSSKVYPMPEGTIDYIISAGGDWVWHLKTTITYEESSIRGAYSFNTEVLEKSEKVDDDRIYVMNGTLMSIAVNENLLRLPGSEDFPRPR